MRARKIPEEVRACRWCKDEHLLRLHSLYEREVEDLEGSGRLGIRLLYCAVKKRSVAVIPDFLVPTKRATWGVMGRTFERLVRQTSMTFESHGGPWEGVEVETEEAGVVSMPGPERQEDWAVLEPDPWLCLFDSNRTPFLQAPRFSSGNFCCTLDSFSQPYSLFLTRRSVMGELRDRQEEIRRSFLNLIEVEKVFISQAQQPHDPPISSGPGAHSGSH